MTRSVMVLAVVFASACSRRPDAPPAGPPARSVILATFADEAVPASSASPAGLAIHPTTPASTPEFFFSDLGGGVAWTVEKDGAARVIHNGRETRSYEAVGKIALSPDGRRCAFGALRDGRWRMVLDGEEGAPFSAIQEPVFSRDGAHLAYVALKGERWYLVVDGKANSGTSGRYDSVVFAGDSRRIAFLEEPEGGASRRLAVADLGFEHAFALDGSVSDFVVNAARTRIAAIVRGEDSWRVVSFAFDAPGEKILGAGYDAAYGVTFGPDGEAVAFRGVRGSAGFVVLAGREERFTGDGVVAQAVGAGGKVVGTLVASGAEIRFHEHFAGGGTDEGPFDQAEGLVYSADGRSHAYVARKGQSWSLIVNGKAGPAFDRAVSPQFSPDGKRVVYRARKDGVRFVVVADTDARTLRQQSPYEQVFPVVFTDDGKAVAYGVKDGRQLAWKVEPL